MFRLESALVRPWKKQLNLTLAATGQVRFLKREEERMSVEKCGGESVLVNGAVFKTVGETVRTGSGRFDSYTPPPIRLQSVDFGLRI